MNGEKEWIEYRVGKLNKRYIKNIMTEYEKVFFKYLSI